MASFRAVGTVGYGANNVANPTNLTPTLPTRLTGDVLIIWTWCKSITATVSTPAGWTLLTGFPKRSGTASGGSVYAFAFVVDGSESAPTVSWSGTTTGTTGDVSGAIICSYSSVDTSGGASGILDGTVTSNDQTGSTTTITIPSITTALTNSLVIGFSTVISVQTTFTPSTTPSTWNEEFDTLTANATDISATVEDLTFAAAGATSTRTEARGTTTSARALSITIALKNLSTLIKTINGLVKASVKTIDGLVIANVKNVQGLG